MNEHELRDLLHQAVPEAPELNGARIAERARKQQRSRVIASGTAVAAVLAVVVGGTALWGAGTDGPGRDKTEQPATQAVDPAPEGTRLVGIGHSAIAVPKEWATNALRCGTAKKPTVVVDVSAIEMCGWIGAEVFDTVWIEPGANKANFKPTSTFEIDGEIAQRDDVECGPRLKSATCTSTVYLPGAHATYRVLAASAERVEEIISWIHIHPEQIAVPGFQRVNGRRQDDDAGAHYRDALIAAGLRVEVRTKSMPGAKPGYILETSPAPGTMLKPGDVVTMTETAEPTGPADEVNVEINSVGPGDSMDYRGRTDAELRAGTTIRLEVGSTIWTHGYGNRIRTLAGEVTGDALTLDGWKEGPNYGRSWQAVKPGTSTLTVTITADGERIVIGRVTVIVR